MSNTTATDYQDISLDQLDPSPTNPRKHYAREPMAGLIKSIQDEGILFPLLVRTHPTAKGSFQIIAGERRFRAASKAGLQVVPCRVVEADDERALNLQALENLAREPLNPLEEAATYQAIMDDTGKNQDQIAAKFGFSQSYIANRLRLLKLPRTWQKKLINETVPVTFGRDLAGWIKWPQVFVELDRAVERIKGNLPTGGIMELSDYRAALADAIHEVGEPYYKLAPLGEGAAIQKELDVVKLPADLGGGQVIMNAERLAELLQEREWEAEEDQTEGPDELPADQAATATPPHVPHENLFYDDADVGPGEPTTYDSDALNQADQEARERIDKRENASHAQTVADRNKANQRATQGPPVDYFEYWKAWVSAEITRRLDDAGFLFRVADDPQFWNTWKPDEAFLKLHTFEQLKAFAWEWGLDMARLEGYKTASQTMIDEILILTTQKRMGFGDEPAHRIGPPLELMAGHAGGIPSGEVSA